MAECIQPSRRAPRVVMEVGQVFDLPTGRRVGDPPYCPIAHFSIASAVNEEGWEDLVRYTAPE